MHKKSKNLNEFLIIIKRKFLKFFFKNITENFRNWCKVDFHIFTKEASNSLSFHTVLRIHLIVICDPAPGSALDKMNPAPGSALDKMDPAPGSALDKNGSGSGIRT